MSEVYPKLLGLVAYANTFIGGVALGESGVDLALYHQPDRALKAFIVGAVAACIGYKEFDFIDRKRNENIGSNA